MDNTRPFRFGILGPGGIAESAHGPALKVLASEGVAELWSVCGRHLDRVDEFATDFGATAPVSRYTDYADFLRDPKLDAVIVCTRDALHAEHAVAAMRAGKHVFVEKPMATTESDAEHMVHVAGQTGMTIGVGYHMRYSAGHRALRDLIRSGTLGEISRIELDWSTLSMSADGWRARGADARWFALAALGTHALDLATWLAWQPIWKLLAESESVRRGIESDERVRITTLHGVGTQSRISVSVVDPPQKLLVVHCEAGTVRCLDTLGSRGTGTITLPNGDLLPFVPVNPYVEQLRAYVDAIRDGRQPEVDGYVGLQNVRWLELVDAHMARGLHSS